MPIQKEYYDALIERNGKTERSARRDTTRDMLRTMGYLALCVLGGLALIGFALHVSDYAVGIIFWWAGHAVWLSGVLFVLLAAYRRGEKRGDW
jgi:uncharacterized YccA/Bax inhibitor family protein